MVGHALAHSFKTRGPHMMFFWWLSRRSKFGGARERLRGRRNVRSRPERGTKDGSSVAESPASIPGHPHAPREIGRG